MSLGWNTRSANSVLLWSAVWFSELRHQLFQDLYNLWSVDSCCSVTQSCLTLRPHGLQHARLSCPSPSPGACSNSCPSSRWCYPTISSSVIPFSSCPQSFPSSGSFQMSQLIALGGQIIGVSASASVLPMNIQGWFPLGLTGLIFLLSKINRFLKKL